MTINNIVLIEDDEFFAKTFTKKLSKLGDYDIIHFTSVEDALDHLESLKPEILFLDHQLGGIDGVDAIPLLLGLSPKSEIVVVSSQPDVSVLELADIYGAKKYFKKDALLMNYTEDFVKFYMEKPSNFKSFWSNLFKSKN